MQQDAAGFPSTSTVQAPQTPAPQTNFVPVRPAVSRMASTAALAGSCSSVTGDPLMFVSVVVMTTC